MKKIFYVAAAFLAAGFVSCSQNDGNDVQGPASDLVPIHFNVGNGRVNIEQKAPATRGTGAVGDVAGDNNIWRGEELNVYMFEKGTLALAKDLTGDGSDLFNNAVILAPTADAASATAEISTQKYYPMQGQFDFFAYHADNAAKGDVVVADDVYTLPVAIDGSQDLMVAKAALTDAQQAMLPAAKADNYYSAYSARQGVNPNFLFKHILTRITFEVKAATANEEDVVIEAIEIEDANTTAEMVIAWVDEPAANLVNQDAPASVFLKEKVADVDGAAQELQALTPVNPTLDFARVGESLMLMPQASYQMMIHMTQNIDGVDRNVSYPYTLEAAALGLDAFEAGKQYNVKFTVYGLSEIVLELELEAWEEGGDIEVDDDQI